MRSLSEEQKEKLREMRRAAYRKAKERRDRDPIFLAMKEKQKNMRKDAYRKIKEAEKERKKKLKEKRDEMRHGELSEIVTTADELDVGDNQSNLETL